MSAPVLFERPEVLDRLPASGHVVIEASAGTGKTHTLERVLVHLLLGGEITIDRILVVTFTERATRELRHRVRQTIRAFALGTRSDPVPPERAFVVDDLARRRLLAALSSFEAATIATIHGFCQRLLMEHAFRGRRLFEQAQVDARDAFGRALRDELRSALADPGPLGRVLVDRVVVGGLEPLEKDLFEASRELGRVTPTWDPAGLARALAAFPSRAERQAALRLAGIDRSLLRHLGELLTQLEGLVAARTSGVLDDLAFGARFWDWAKETRQFAGARMSTLDGVYATLDVPRRVSPVLQDLVSVLERLEDLAPTELSLLFAELLPRVRARLERSKSARGTHDFDDMLEFVRQTLADPAQRDGLVEAVLGRHAIALIDEFQDTDETQWEIFRTLFFDRGRLFVIGDPKQAIYGFRSADVETYKRAVAELERAGGVRLGLSASYRATPEFAEVQNHLFVRGFFTHLAVREPVRAARAERALVHADGRRAAPVRLLQLYAHRRKLTLPAIQAGLGGAIAREIRAIVEGDPLHFVGSEGPEPIGYRDVFVLVRTRAEGERIGRSLRRHGIPHGHYRQEGLLESDEATDLLDVLLALAQPHDESLIGRALLTPFFGVSVAELPAARGLDERHPLGARLAYLAELAESRRYARLFDALLYEGGLVRRLLFAREGERELTNYLQLFEVLRDEVARGHPSVLDLARALRAYAARRRLPADVDANVERAEGDPNIVQILTMHKSKGLEAKVVFVAGGFTAPRARTGAAVYHHESERRVRFGPAVGRTRAAVEREEREEAERLMYVALTRAAARLYLPYFGPPIGAATLPAGADTEPTRLDGAYRVVNDRLNRLPGELGADAFSRSFEIVPVECEPEYAEVRRAAEVPAVRIGEDELPAPPPPLGGELAGLAASTRGLVVTSYTRLLRAQVDTDRAEDGVRELLEGLDREVVPTGPGELPAGRRTGIFLHALLELADFAAVRAASSVESWLGEAGTRELLGRAAIEHGLSDEAAELGGRLVFSALRCPIRVGALSLPEGLAGTTRRAAELEFVFPIPEEAHPRIGELRAAGRLVAERGFVRGVIDLVFESDERWYFLDYKSDLVDDPSPEALAEHVREAYALQAQIYTLAVARALGLTDRAQFEARFGGILYCFLRPMAAGVENAGVSFQRPTFDDLVRYEDELRARRVGPELPR